ncbi:amidohydrolase family protein [Leucobacter rhizosphaerae]|uniref:Amidohydrolase family protein n=1 Tax=Leucobacter rhizosphaerae TaxID=2932245 RepID=A0ABY4FZ46_9MICO|nr:amidohydrolase family protein [Leucobacter rhizosphaerae]UOQ61582.1 amidohydrolase family protein [Leucobacter rhizosphaerae]
MDAEHFSRAVHALPLIDHHVHSVLPRDLERVEFEVHLSESAVAAPAGTTHLDSQAGFAARRHCAPLLDLPAHSAADAYLARRAELGWREATARLLHASGVSTSLIDTGHAGTSLLSNPDFAALSAQEVREIVRLESVAERLIDAGVAAHDFPDALRRALGEAAATGAAGFKSVIAYRAGFDVDPERPSDAEAIAAVADERRTNADAPARVSHPDLLRFLLWSGADTGLPLQLHVGYGDADLDLARCNPALLMPWLRRLPDDASPIMLLHCYPYHREAGYLAQVFPNVYFDLGLAINYTGAASTAVIREGLELAPFGKLLYSSDAWGLPELHLLGAQLWRDGLARALWEFVERGEWSESEALRVAELTSSENARRVYQL